MATKARTLDLEVPLRVLLTLPKDSYRAFELDSPVGSFDPHSLILNVALPKQPAVSVPGTLSRGIDFSALASAIREKLSPNDPIDRQLMVAIHDTAWLHERQHFTDTLSTPAGAHMFIEEAERLTNLSKAFVMIRRRGYTFDRPISLVTRNSDIEDKYKEDLVNIVNYIIELFLIRNWFNGDTPSFFVDSIADDRSMVGAFASNRELHGISPIPYFLKFVFVDSERKCIADPIGFRSLTEARAIFLQNEVVSMVSHDLSDHFIKSMKPLREYSVANMTFTKCYKVSGAIGTDNNIGHNYWRWLFHSLHGGGPQGDIRYPGRNALHLAIESIDSNGFKHDTYSLREKEQNASLQKRASTLYSHTCESQPFSHFVSFVINSMILPSLQYYQNHDDKFLPRDYPLETNVVISDRSKKIHFKGGTLPEPFGYYDGRVGHLWLTEDEIGDGRMILSWFYWIAFRMNLVQAWSGANLLCPIARGRYSGFMRGAGIRVCSHCPTNNGKLPRCGCLKVGRNTKAHVQCPWKEMLEWQGFISKRS